MLSIDTLSVSLRKKLLQSLGDDSIQFLIILLGKKSGTFILISLENLHRMRFM